MNALDPRREKERIIQRVQLALDNIPDRIHSQNSFKIAEKLFRLPEFQKAEMLAVFVGFDSEVDTMRLMDASLELGKRIAAPTTDTKSRCLIWREVKNPNKDIDLGPLGIPQPLATCREVDPNSLDLITVPGVAWDLQGHRLARWTGYFDRFLNNFPRKPRIGLAFELQIVDDLSALVSNVFIDTLITEDEMRKPRSFSAQSGMRIPGGPKGYKG